MAASFSEKDLALRAQYPDVPLIDTTTRRRAKSCRRAASILNHAPFGRGLRPKTNAPALDFGIAIHEALDSGYSQGHETLGYDYGRMPGYFSRLIDANIATIKEGYKPWPDQVAQYEEQRTLGVAMLEEYARWAPSQDDFTVVMSEHAGLVPVYAKPGVEWQSDGYGDMVPLPRDGTEVIALYYFRTDGIVRDALGRLWVLEHKTCKRWWTDAMLQLDEQITAYMWAEQAWFGEPMAGVLMNFLLKDTVEDPDLLKNGKPTTAISRLGRVTAARYGAACEATFGDDGRSWSEGHAAAFDALTAREKESGHPTIRRERVTRSPEAVAIQGRRIVEETMDLLRPDRPTYPTPSYACGWCPAYAACLLMEEGQDAEWLIQQNFEMVAPMWDRHDVDEEVA